MSRSFIQLKLFLLLITVCASCWSQSLQSHWTVQPSVCIVASLGDQCEMELNIAVNQLPKGEYCYYQDSALLQCWTDTPPQENLRLRFSQSTTLHLKNHQGQTLLSHEIQIKAREQASTRRVRQPWSLF